MADGGSELNRFTAIIPILATYTKTVGQDQYFDDFTTRADTEDTIGTD